MYLNRQGKFTDNTHFLIVDKLVHGCMTQADGERKDVSVKDYLDVMRRYKAVEVTMKELQESGETHLDASYTRDPTQKS